MDRPHPIGYVRGLEYGPRKPSPGDGLTTPTDYIPGVGFGFSVTFPHTITEGSGAVLEFGVCCRKDLDLDLTFSLNNDDDPPVGYWTVTKIDKDGTTTVWNSNSETITDGLKVDLNFTLNLGPCGAVIEVHSPLNGSGTGASLEVAPDI